MNFTFQIQHHSFDSILQERIRQNSYISDLWPLVYIISDDHHMEAYVGETTDAVSRMFTHLKHDEKKRLSTVHLITSEVFNKSATLDIESNLIRYFSGDGKYNLLNGNVGIANHTYYQKNEVYWEIFKKIWQRLRKEGLARNTIESIDNSDLFKYSPYKALTPEQTDGIIMIMKALIDKKARNVIVEGGAGTGKTIMAVYLFKLLHTDLENLDFRDFGEKSNEILQLAGQLKDAYPDPRVALVVPMASFRQTLGKVFKHIKGLNAKMVIGPAELAENKYDILFVDESHRLRKRLNLGAYYGNFDKVNAKIGLGKDKGNELDWVVKRADKRILFYDKAQSIKPSDVDQSDFDRIKAMAQTVTIPIRSQFRVRGGTDYVDYIDRLLHGRMKPTAKMPFMKGYEFVFFDSLADMIALLDEREKEYGLCRIVAGYAWKWVSKGGAPHDIEIGQVKLKWNSVDKDWVNSPNAPKEVGCIHTTQGYDLNYTGVIFGHEVSYDPATRQIVVREEHYHDRNGKQSISDPEALRSYIINIYKTLMLRGIRGTYVHVCDPHLRDYLAKHIPTASNYSYNDLLSMAAEN